MTKATYNLRAQGNAKVGTMIGVVHGNATFYSIGEQAAPEAKFRVGLNYLKGNVPRKAEELIHEAVIHHYRDARVAYYWALALVSGRAFDHLDDDDFEKLNAAVQMAREQPAGETEEEQWLPALHVVVEFIQCLAVAQGVDEEETDGSEFYTVMDLYERRPEERRDEIRRHMDMILVGGLQDQIDDVDAEKIRQERLGNDRLNRVPTFFLPPPAAPRRRPLVSRRRLDGDVVIAGFGCVLVTIGVLLSVVLLISVDVLALLAALALWAGGGYAAVRFGRQRSVLIARRMPPEVWTGEKPRASQRATDGEGATFQQDLREMIEIRFRDHRPTAIEADLWERETAQVRDTVLTELTAQYSWDRSEFAPIDIDWLVSWHAHDAARRWREGRTVVTRHEPQSVPLALTASYAGGVTAIYLGLLAVGYAAVSAISSLGWVDILVGVGAVLALLVGLLLALNEVPGIAIEKERARVDEEARERRFEIEEAAHQRWVDGLAARPTDAEMARWLDYDKAYIKNLALKHFGLRNRDLIGHVILTQSGVGCLRARVLGGPPRYSAYQVRLFLLAKRGVREITIHLDFVTGATFNERRTSFRYDSITSAEVGEVSVRLDDGKRLVERVDRGRRNGNGSQKLTFAHALHLTLNDGSSTFVLVENFDLGLFDRVRESVAHLEELARDAAGVTGALRILEAIAAEGADWVDEERKRRNRRIRHYRERQRRRYGELERGHRIDLGRALPHQPVPPTVQYELTMKPEENIDPD